MRISDWSSDVCSSDLDHLYRYANLMDLMGEGRKAQDITGDLTEILPGRPPIFEHRDPRDELRQPMTLPAADTQSGMNALPIVSAEQQIGRASCRDRVCQYVEISWGAGPIKKKT